MKKWNGWLVGAAAAAVAVMVTTGASAQTTTTAGATDPAVEARQHELARITADRGGVIREIVDRWGTQLRAGSPALNLASGDEQLTVALQSATIDVLFAAGRAESYEELSGLLRGYEPGAIALEPGRQIPNTLGSTTNDLVFTPLSPCRIIDTRLATNAALLGRIGPNAGKQFQVNLADYSSQGGLAGTCGIGLNVEAVAVNVTSTDQTGPGNLRVVETGGGIPNVSLLNYSPGVNLANAAVVRARNSGTDDIFIYSGNSASHVIVDILGFFTRPEATAVENNVLYTETNIAASASFTIFSPACPAGWRLTGGGALSASFAGPAPVGSRPAAGASSALVTGVNLADRWCCQGTNGVSAQNYQCFSVCSRVPGR